MARRAGLFNGDRVLQSFMPIPLGVSARRTGGSKAGRTVIFYGKRVNVGWFCGSFSDAAKQGVPVKIERD